jgi:hypothetical protein
MPVRLGVQLLHVIEAGSGQNMKRRHQKKCARKGHEFLHGRRQVIQIWQGLTFFALEGGFQLFKPGVIIRFIAAVKIAV